MSDDLFVKSLAEQYASKNGRVLSILEAIQRKFKYLPEELMRLTAEELGLPLSQIYGVATFYNYFSLQPRGEHTVGVCHGTACHVKRADKLTEALEKRLDVGVGGTTGDGLYSLEAVRCLGCCSLAPVVSIDGVIHARVKRDSLGDLLKHACSEVAGDD